MPPDAWLAATVNRLISVAVSKPSPNKKPTGNICQLRDTMRNSGRNMRASKPRPESRRSSSCSATGSPRRAAAKALPDAAQNDEIDDGDGEQEKRRSAGADDAADRLELLEAALQRERRAAIAATASAIDSEWPSEKNRPTETGRLPSCISLRTTLSMVGDVVGIDGVAQAEHISEKCGAEQRRPVRPARSAPRSRPRRWRRAENVDRDNLWRADWPTRRRPPFSGN